jgi:basic amino acid/polyamine antiporter, APA family
MSLLLRKKSIYSLIDEAAETGLHTLRRKIGAFGLISIGVGVIIGAGIFSLTGIASANNSGPAIILSFALAALCCSFNALCYAEFASLVPVAGSAYTYSYATLGEFFAWIIGWDLILEYSVGAATVAISWSQYLLKFLSRYNINLPPQLTLSPFESIKATDGSVIYGIINLPAILIVVLVTIIIIRGVGVSSIVTSVIVILKVSIVLVFIAVGWHYINPSNYHPFIPKNTGTFGEYGISGIFRGAGVIFFVFIGFDIVATMAQETKNPQRNMPVGIIGSLIVCTILFVLFAYVMTGMANYTEFKNSAAPVAIAIDKTPFKWLGQLIIFAILIGYISVILVDLMGQSRVFFSMSHDGLLPKMFSSLHHKFQTPYKSNILLCVFICLFAGFVPIRVVGEMTSIGTLLAFVLVCTGILVLRKTQPDVPRAFKTPFVPLVPVLGITSSLLLMFSLPAGTWIRLIVWLVIGFVIYFSYGRKNSKLNKKSESDLPISNSHNIN